MTTNKTKLALPQEVTALIKQKRDLLERIAAEQAVETRAATVQAAHAEAKIKADAVAERLRAARGAVFAGKASEEEVSTIEAEQREADAALQQAASDIDAARSAAEAARQALTITNDELAKLDTQIREHVRL
jgi:hypothetical protein